MKEIHAYQWFENGDHPDDQISYTYRVPEDKLVAELSDFVKTEGAIVRYFRHPRYDGQSSCNLCGQRYHFHGYLENHLNSEVQSLIEHGTSHEMPELIGMVCPGDWIVDHGHHPNQKTLYTICTQEDLLNLTHKG